MNLFDLTPQELNTMLNDLQSPVECEGVDNAVKHYSKYKFFDHAWINEVEKE